MELGEIDLSHWQAPDALSLLGTLHQSLSAVAWLHSKRVVHLDIKPGNFVFFAARLKLVDFGCACTLPESGILTRAGPFEGTLDYMAPEALQERDASVCLGTDVWGLGCTFHRIVTGALPFPPAEARNLDAQRRAVAGSPALHDPGALLGGCGPEVMHMLGDCLRAAPHARPTVQALLGRGIFSPGGGGGSGGSGVGDVEQGADLATADSLPVPAGQCQRESVKELAVAITAFAQQPAPKALKTATLDAPALTKQTTFLAPAKLDLLFLILRNVKIHELFAARGVCQFWKQRVDSTDGTSADWREVFLALVPTARQQAEAMHDINWKQHLMDAYLILETSLRAFRGADMRADWGDEENIITLASLTQTLQCVERTCELAAAGLGLPIKDIINTRTQSLPRLHQLINKVCTQKPPDDCSQEVYDCAANK